MKLTENFKPRKKPIMILGTSSGSGKSLTVTAICRILKNKGEDTFPFKGQNMSNNAWVDCNGGEMAYSQALQALAAREIPSSEMNPILLKPQGNSISEVIHLGKSIGITSAKDYLYLPTLLAFVGTCRTPVVGSSVCSLYLFFII